MASFKVVLEIEIDDKAVMPKLLNSIIKETIEDMGTGAFVKVTKIKVNPIAMWKVINDKHSRRGQFGKLASARSGTYLLEFIDGAIEEFTENELEFVIKRRII